MFIMRKSCLIFQIWKINQKQHPQNNEKITYFKSHCDPTVVSWLKIAGKNSEAPVNGGRGWYFSGKLKNVRKTNPSNNEMIIVSIHAQSQCTDKNFVPQTWSWSQSMQTKVNVTLLLVSWQGWLVILVEERVGERLFALFLVPRLTLSSLERISLS